jgi:hypothetical protein
MKQFSFPFDNIVTIIGFLALTVTLTLLTRPGVVEGLKHNYYTKRDERSLIGPLGFPFGFLDTGHYNLTVFDFQLSVPKKRHKHEQHHSRLLTNGGDSSNSRNAAAAADASMLSDVLDNIKGAGFLLKQFEDEAAFNHYIAQVQADPSNCVFQKYIDLKEAEQMDDAFYYDQDDFSNYADDDYDPEYYNDDYDGEYDDGYEEFDDYEGNYRRRRRRRQRVLKRQQPKRQQRTRQSQQKQLNNNRILVADGEEEEQGYGEVIDAVQDGIYLDMLPRSRWRPNSPTVAYNFEAGQAGFYFLIYQVCYKDEPPAENNQNNKDNNYLDIHSRFELDFLFSNIDMYVQTKTKKQNGTLCFSFDVI